MTGPRDASPGWDVAADVGGTTTDLELRAGDLVTLEGCGGGGYGKAAMA